MWTVLLMSDIQWISGWPSLMRAVSCGYMRALSYESSGPWLQEQSLIRVQWPLGARSILSYENSGPWLQGQSSLKRTAAHGCNRVPLLQDRHSPECTVNPLCKKGINRMHGNPL